MFYVIYFAIKCRFKICPAGGDAGKVMGVVMYIRNHLKKMSTKIWKKAAQDHKQSAVLKQGHPISFFLSENTSERLHLLTDFRTASSKYFSYYQPITGERLLFDINQKHS